MSLPEVRLQRLGPHHDLSSFESGNGEFDDWLRRHAVPAQEMDSARTFVLTSSDRVVAYFSLTMGSVRRADAPAKLVRNLPGYPIGMVVLGRLAVAHEEQGKGTGALLLTEALRKAVSAGEAVAARLVVVDAVDDDAARFCERHGFAPAPGHQQRLYRRIRDIRSSLDQARQGAR